jgi:hypothetical protein
MTKSAAAPALRFGSVPRGGGDCGWFGVNGVDYATVGGALDWSWSFCCWEGGGDRCQKGKSLKDGGEMHCEV